MKTSRALIVGGASAVIIAGAVIAAPAPLNSDDGARADEADTAQGAVADGASPSDDDCDKDIDPSSNSGRGNTEDPIEERERDDNPSGDDCLADDEARGDNAAQNSAQETGIDPEETAVAGAEVIDGPVVNNIRGDYQVRLHIEGGVVVDVEFPVAGTSASESRRINEMALPVLEERFLEAQSADVEAVSGASFTSPAMIESAAAAFADAGL